METVAQMVCSGAVRISVGQVLVGPCRCDCPPVSPISLDALWQSWLGLGNWGEVGEGSAADPPQDLGEAQITAVSAYPPPVSAWGGGAEMPVGRYRVSWSGGLWRANGAGAGMVGDYVGAPFDVYRTPRVALGAQDAAGSITDDVRGPMGGELSVDFDLLTPASLGIYIDDGWSQARGASWYADNSLVGGPLVFGLMRLSSVPLAAQRHRGCLRFVWVCVSGGEVRSWEVLGGDVTDPLEKVLPFVPGDGQHFFAVEFYGLRLGNTPGGRTYISRDDDWVIHRWENPPA